MIMNHSSKFSMPAIIEPDYDEGPPRRKQRFKKICSIQHQSKYHPIPCPPPSLVVSGLQLLANLVQPSIPQTVIIVKKQRPKVKECIETESSSNGIKRKRVSTTSPQVKRRPLFCAPPNAVPSSLSSILPPGKPLEAPPSLPRLASADRIIRTCASGTRTSPQKNNTMPLVKRRPLFCAPPKIPSSPSSMVLPLGKPLAAATSSSLPRLAAGQAIPKLSAQ
jgi:hypothetical protein